MSDDTGEKRSAKRGRGESSSIPPQSPLLVDPRSTATTTRLTVKINNFDCAVTVPRGTGDRSSSAIQLYPEVYFGPFVLLQDVSDGTVYLPGPDGSVSVKAGSEFHTVKFVGTHIVVAGRLAPVDAVPPGRKIGAASFHVAEEPTTSAKNEKKIEPGSRARVCGFASYVRHRGGVSLRVAAMEWRKLDVREKERWRRLGGDASAD